MIAVLVVYGINETWQSETRQGLIFILFSVFMAVGAFCSWAYLPDVQRRVAAEDDPYDDNGTGTGTARSSSSSRLETKTLEELGEGRERARRDGDAVTIRDKVERIKRRKRGVLRSGSGYDMRQQEFGRT